MVARIVGWSAAHRAIVLAGALGAALWGLWAMAHAPLDAVPDISDVQVIVSTEWAGRSPDLIEAQITYPIVTALTSTPRVKAVRGFTDLGVSSVYVIFEDGTDIYWARSRVAEYLDTIRSRLPQNVVPSLGPDATGAGWVFEYALVDATGQHNLADLRGFQDWTLRYQLASIPGVAEIASIGGFVRQYQIVLDPQKLAAYDVAASDVIAAIRSSNNDVDGRVLEASGREYMMRGRGRLSSIDDIENVAIDTRARGVPLRVRDVARVRVGPDMRRGAAELNGTGEVVGGIVVMRFGENALHVVDAVKAKLAEAERTMPPGVRIVPAYDRSTLIRDAIGTLRRTLIEEALIVSIVIAVFLLHAPSAFVPILILPIAVLASFIPMYYLGLTSNIMSLGGLALAIGVLVDASIVMVENAYRRVSEFPTAPGARADAIIRAAKQVARPLVYSLAIVVVSFAPVFLLEAQEGRMFRPLAFAKTFTMMAATALSITVAPVLMVLLIRGRRLRREADNPLSRWLGRLYASTLQIALEKKWTALLVNGAVIAVTIPLVFSIGREFMPPLEEHSQLFMPTAPPGMSTSEATRLLQIQDRIIRAFPEVDTVFGTVGRGNTATDNTPMGMANTIIAFKPRDQWRPGVTPDTLQREMDAQLQFPGVSNIWTQPVRNRLDMLLTGIRTPLGIKVLGPDLVEIERLASSLQKVLQDLPATRNVSSERTSQGFFTDVQLDRAAIARYGLRVAEVEEVIESAIGGQEVTQTYEGRERYPVNVRYGNGFRQDAQDLARVVVRTPGGAYVPLSQVAAIRTVRGPSMIRDEGGQLAGYVYVDVKSGDIPGYVSDARAAIARTVRIPAGYSLEWTGQYEFEARARRRLAVVIPLVLVAIFALLWTTFKSASESAIVMLSVVYAMCGGVVLQWMLGYNFSVAVWVGYIALYGVAVQTGVVMVTYLHEALDARIRRGGVLSARDVLDATISGSVRRLRPKLMTVTVVVSSLMPILWRDGVGSDLMKPIAVPIIGGMVTSTVHVLIITPIIFYLVKTRELRRGRLRESGLSASSSIAA